MLELVFLIVISLVALTCLAVLGRSLERSIAAMNKARAALTDTGTVITAAVDTAIRLYAEATASALQKQAVEASAKVAQTHQRVVDALSSLGGTMDNALVAHQAAGEKLFTRVCISAEAVDAQVSTLMLRAEEKAEELLINVRAQTGLVEESRKTINATQAQVAQALADHVAEAALQRREATEVMRSMLQETHAMAADLDRRAELHLQGAQDQAARMATQVAVAVEARGMAEAAAEQAQARLEKATQELAAAREEAAQAVSRARHAADLARQACTEAEEQAQKVRALPKGYGPEKVEHPGFASKTGSPFEPVA